MEVRKKMVDEYKEALRKEKLRQKEYKEKVEQGRLEPNAVNFYEMKDFTVFRFAGVSLNDDVYVKLEKWKYCKLHDFRFIFLGMSGEDIEKYFVLDLQRIYEQINSRRGDAKILDCKEVKCIIVVDGLIR